MNNMNGFDKMLPHRNIILLFFVLVWSFTGNSAMNPVSGHVLSKASPASVLNGHTQYHTDGSAAAPVNMMNNSIDADLVVHLDAESVVKYILSCRKPNGAFGPAGQQYTDVAWTFPAAAALTILKSPVPSTDSCYHNGSRSWMEKASWKNGPWYWSLQQKARLYKLFGITGELEPEFPAEKSWTVQFKPRRGYLELRNYIHGDFFDMASLYSLAEAAVLTKGTVENPQTAGEYILIRQAENGAFEDMLGERSHPENRFTHLSVTHDAVMTLTMLGIPIPDTEKIIRWIRSCQTKEGGFRWSPDNPSQSNMADVWYTCIALETLKALGEQPENSGTCIEWLNSLQNSDGGFGDRPGWKSRLYSTYHALQALEILTGDARKGITEKNLPRDKTEEIPEGKYSIFQAHHKSPAGKEGMVDTVAGMKLNLIAVKVTEKEILAGDGMSETVHRARNYAEKKNYSLEIIDCPENYAHRLIWFNGQRGDHVSNMILPPHLSDEIRKKYLGLYQEGLKGLPWNDFREKVIKPALEIKTLFYPELDYTMLNAYMVYDEGLQGGTGYNAVPAAHFGNIDWVRHFPYKERWIGILPMIADGDAHGNIVKWRPNLDSYRNVFIAKSCRYDDYLEASFNGRSVCVIRMPETGEIRYYGAEYAVEYLKRHLDEWKWW